MSEQIVEVYRQHRLAQDKYSYFLLAAAGAAIALAARQTAAASFAWSQIPLGGAVLSWGLSFFFGCRYLAYVSSTLYSNMELLRVEAGLHPKAGERPEAIAAASEGIRQAIETNSDRMSRLARLQFGFLISGGVLYIAWHVWEMWLRTASQGGTP